MIRRMYLVVIGILAIVLTFPEPLHELVVLPGLVLTCVAVATLVPAAVAWQVSRRTLAVLEAQLREPAHGQMVYGRGMAVVHATLGLCHGFVLLATGWIPLCAEIPVIGGWPGVAGIIGVVPFLLSTLLVWLALYPADRAVRQIALEIYLFRGRPAHPVWTLGRFLAYNLRHQVLFILVPMLIILVASDFIAQNLRQIRELAGGLRYAPDLLIGLVALGVAVVAPEILRHIWITQRLPEGPLRDRLQLLCKKLRMRCRDILVWRSGGMIVNAAVMGVVAPLRYVLITDAMLEQLDDTKIEAVFGHEAGHVKHHHILLYLMFALISGCIITVASVYARELTEQQYQVVMTGVGLLLAAKWGLLFGWISRRFERQADWHGVQTMMLAGMPRETAAHVFAAALHDVAVLNGIPPEARSWRHSSIGSRARFLISLARDPARLQRFERLLLVIRAGVVLVAIAAAVWTAYVIGVMDTLFGWLRG